jgi:ligand-binding sensor domain-containing protein
MGLLLYDGTQVSWYRTNDLVGDLEKLHVACNPKACYMASGTGQAYRFDGKTFEPADVDPDPAVKILTFVNDRSGEVISIHSSGDGRSLVASKLSGDSFSRIFSAKIAFPKGSIGVRFSRFDPEGKLWLGLSYLEEDGTQRPWGVVVVGMSGADIMYHRSTLMPGEKRLKGSLALPDDIRDIQFFGGYAWLSTGAGACRVKGNQVLLYTENEGLESEIIHRFAVRPNGVILAATHGGVGRFDGKVWRFDFDEPLRQATRALLLESGVLWAGTSRGLVRRNDRNETRLIDMTEGLVGTVIKDLKKDPFGRLWVLTDQGLSIVDRVP